MKVDQVALAIPVCEPCIPNASSMPVLVTAWSACHLLQSSV